MTSTSASPRFFIQMKEPGFAGGHMFGGNGAEHLQHWHLRDSIANLVDSPLRYWTNYVHEENLPDFLSTSEYLIVSPRMRAFLEPWLKQYEFLPVELETTRGRALNSIGGKKKIQGYSLLNCWLRLDVIDFEQSDIMEVTWRPAEPGTPVTHSHSWKSLVLRQPIPADAHLFGFERLLGERRFISPALHSAMVGAGLVVDFAAVARMNPLFLTDQEIRQLCPVMVHGLQKAPKPAKGAMPTFTSPRLWPMLP